MNVVLRGVRLVDPASDRDQARCDVWLRDGRLAGVGRRVRPDGARVVDLTPQRGAEPLVVCPGFVDLHAHLREPGEEAKETVASGSRAAAAGGFTQVVAMANTTPAIDTPAAVVEAGVRASAARIRVLQASAVTRGLKGGELVDIAGCAAAGAAAHSDDGRNALSRSTLAAALAAAEQAGRAVLVHPEDEALVLAANPGAAPASVTRCPERPPLCEASAVETALAALADAGRGRLHLQHLSAAAALEPLRRAREAGRAVTAEVTPHHLALWLPFAVAPHPEALVKVNPPLRTHEDRDALVHALREGLVDAVATDHAPHRGRDKSGRYERAAPGMVGLETALALCLTLGGMGGGWLPTLIARLTEGPWRALGAPSGLRRPGLRRDEPADLVLLDPAAEWTVDPDAFHSASANTPLAGTRLRGRVLLTVADGRVAHVDPDHHLVREAFQEATPVA